MKDTLYLVTGATGFLGSNITRTLVARGMKIRALVRESSPAVKSIPPEVEITTGDLLDMDSLEQLFSVSEHMDLIVLHSASFVTVAPEWNQKVYEINVTGTKNIIDQCIKHKVKKLVSISSTGAITELPHGQKITEPEHFEPTRVMGCYAQTKAIAAQLVFDAVAERDLDASIVYPSGIFGPNDYGFTFVSKFITDYKQGKMPAGISGSFNAVDVRDLADGVIACALKGKKGHGYIMSNTTVTLRELFYAVHKYTGGREIKLMLPLPAARCIARIAETVSKITKKPTLLTTFTIYNLARNNDFDCSKAMRELGYSCRPFEETIRDTVQWLITEGRLEE